MTLARAALIVVALVAGLSNVSAHTLGIDKSDLTEKPDGTYHLVSRVPQKIAPAITTLQLPDRCQIQGDPRGSRGGYQVRFIFTCRTSLTADDQIILPWKREGVLLTVNWIGAEPVTRFTGRDGAAITVNLGEYLAGSGSLWHAAKRYTRLGAEHILDGFDHLLFVLALLIIVADRWRLIKTITAFTVAHSITLALATLGLVRLPAPPVEAAIALSIVFLCVEILNRYRGRTSLTFDYPWIVAFAFGLLHGLGFAGALSQIGLPPAEIPQALLFFNIGVEIGQILFVAVILAVMGLWRMSKFSWSGWVRMVPAYAVGTIATFWFFERAIPIFLP